MTNPAKATLVSVGVLLTMFVSATDLYWQGVGTDASPAVWKGATEIWKVDNAGDLVSWNSVSEPRTAYFTTGTHFALQGPAPKAIVVDSDEFVRYLVGSQSTWGNAWGSLTNFVKRGTGRFEAWDQNNMVTGGSGLGNRSNAYFDVQEGTFTVEVSSTKDGLASVAKNFLGGSKIRVASGATAHLKSQLGFAYETGYQPSLQLDGGSFIMSSWGQTNYFNEIIYNGGQVTLWDAVSSSDLLKVTTVMGKFSVTGTVARTLSIANDAKAFLSFSPTANQTELYVDDVTSSPDTDFTIVETSGFKMHNGFIKTGAGTLQLNRNFDANTRGRFEVREGKVRLYEAQNFMTCDAYEFVVMTNGTLELPLRNNISASWSIYHGLYAKTRYHVSGGSFIVGDTNLWGHCNLGDELLLDNATFTCRLTGTAASDSAWGALTLSRQVTLRGETPYVFSPNDWSKESNAAYHFYPESEGGTIVTVADISGDSAVDATFNVRLRDYISASNRNDVTSAPDHTMSSGLTKKGTGTLYLANPKNSFTGPVRVNEGTVWTDGPASSAVVAAGAYLGGTGTVAAVSLAEGAGFSVKVGQKQPLKVTAAVTLPASGVIDIVCPGELPRIVNVPVLASAATVTGDLSGWSVRLNGAVDPQFVVEFRQGGLCVRRPRGCVVIFK